MLILHMSTHSFITYQAKYTACLWGGLSLHPLDLNYKVWSPPYFLHNYVHEQLLMHSQGMVFHVSYVYLDHLMALNSCVNPYPWSVKTFSLKVYSPLNFLQWTSELKTLFSSFILQEIKCGFRIGFN